MNIDMKKRLQELRQQILKKDISYIDAVSEFITLINSYEEKTEIDTSLFTRNNIFINNLIEINKKIDAHNANLNKILILRELGVGFEEKEIDKILSKTTFSFPL